MKIKRDTRTIVTSILSSVLVIGLQVIAGNLIFFYVIDDVRSDLDLRAILPTSLPALNETLPPASLPQPLPPPSIADTGGTSSDDDSSSNSDDE